jgi:catechol 2,3-dioxygenase-like lactoylglutathione lyase family enzyme
MPITGFDHYTLRCQDVDVTARFYQDIMGFRAQPLDEIGFPFRLMFHGEQALVHLMGAGPALDAFLARSAPCYQDEARRVTGNLEHVAFNATGLGDFMAALKTAGIPFVERDLADYGVTQLMFDDPDGVELEVNFPIAEKRG